MNLMIKGESEEYRKLRNQLLEAEIAMKDQTERVAALRSGMFLPAATSDPFPRAAIARAADICLVY